MSKQHDRTQDSEPSPAEPAMMKSLPFTLKIINPDGVHYYKVESRALGVEREITDPHLLDLVNRKIGLEHNANEPAAMFCGTFIVNLAALKE
jgi:hypothetical protein